MYNDFAQTRMETIAAEMDPTQARSYSLLMMCILRHSSICSGESTDQLAQALLLLRKVCFHASLLCHTGRNSAPPPRCGAPSGANKYITSTSPITVDGGYYAGGLVNPVLRPATHPGGSSSGGSSSSSGELYWPLTADRPATQWRPAGPGLYAGGGAINPSGDYVQHLSGGFTATPLGDIAFAQGPIAAPPSRFRDTPTQERLELGSCKLVCLRRLVWRFAGLKVAVVVETAEECALVQQLLVLLNVKFDTAFHCDYLDDVVDCTINPTDDSLIGGVCKATRWVDAQNSVQSFNSPQNSSSFLLCSKHVFQSPNIPPHQADAVVILSDDWVSTTDVKDCFRLRLLSAGPTGPPLTVVRVVAAASIEERMVRKGTSFLQLQGTPLAQLRTGFLSHPPATAVTAAAPGSDLAKDSQHVGGGDAAEEFTLLCKAPTLFAPSIPRTSSSSASASTSLTSPQHDAGHSVPTKEPSQSALTKGNEGEQGGRGKGKGKGFIMVGKQGATTLVKEQDAAHSMVLFRGARGTNGDLLRHPDTLAWIQRLRRDMQVAEREFKRRDRSVSFQRSRNVSQTHTLQVPFLSHRPVSPLAEHNAMEVVVSGEENVDLKFTTPNTRSDATICSAFLEINYILGRMVLNSVPSDQRANHLHRCPTGVLKILESRWVDAIANLQEATHRKLCDEDEENDNEFAVVTPDSAVCPPLSEWQIRRLHASGLGMNAAENMLSALVLPYRANGTMPQESSAPIKMKTEAENTAAPSSSSFWPQSFFVFRDVLAETRRQGIHLEATLHVNPLQSACRNDTITAAAHNRAHLGEEDSMCIKYVVDGGKGSAGTSRSSKSRRSRPSASRKKDPSGAAANNNNNGASAADGSSAAQEADDGTAEGGAMQSQLGQDFEVGFLSDLDPMGDSPQKSSQQGKAVVYCCFILLP